MAYIATPSGYGAGNIVRPTLPADFTAAHASQTRINLSWTEVGSPKFVQIERSLTDSAYVLIATILGGVGTYADTGLTANTTYYYRYRQRDRLK